MTMDKKLPIGIENFEEIRTEGFYYIDKTGLIKELLHSWGKVNLFTRPRRFGKSLNMNMLKSFFEIGCKKELFSGLAIAKEVDLCKEYMGKFPVISISLKGIGGDDFEMASLLNLSRWLCKHYGQKVIILINEYDVPLAKAFEPNIVHAYPGGIKLRRKPEHMQAYLRYDFRSVLKSKDQFSVAINRSIIQERHPDSLIEFCQKALLYGEVS